MFAYWRVVQIDIEAGFWIVTIRFTVLLFKTDYSTDDRFLFYGLNNYNSREFETSYLEGSGDWETLYDNEISFEFKTDMYGYEQVDYMRFTLFLICKKP